MARVTQTLAALALVAWLVTGPLEAGVIKNIFQKITNTGNKTEDTVEQSVPICGSGLFSSSNQSTLSPEFIFITGSPSRTLGSRNARSPGRERDSHAGDGYPSSGSSHAGPGGGGYGSGERVSEVAREFRFHAENVTLAELEEHGFNRNAPVTFLMHGFTSGYPLQAWISAMVEAYTIDRESSGSYHRSPSSFSSSSSSSSSYSGHSPNSHSDYNYGNSNYGSGSNYEDNNSNYNNNNNRGRDHSHHAAGQHQRNRRADSLAGSRARNSTGAQRDSSAPAGRSRASAHTTAGASTRRATGVRPVGHNLFIINWNYAARGLLYPRAVANIPIVATFATRFINEKLLDEAGVDPKRVQLIGHSLGAHLAGFIGKNTRTRLGRIYGLDPAGPCFGSGLKDLVYPAGQRLAPSDADEVITISTNSALLGIDKPLGKYSVFVEGGADQPGCKASGVLKSLGTLTFDGGDFDTVACSHSRAPNLLTYRLGDPADERADDATGDTCHMVAYACKDWEAFANGQCGVCTRPAARTARAARSERSSPLEPVECLRVGLDWQYSSSAGAPGGQHSSSAHGSHGSDNYDHYKPSGGAGRSTSRPYRSNGGGSSSSSSSLYPSSERQRRDSSPAGAARNESAPGREQERALFGASSGGGGRRKDAEVDPIVMFMRTGDTQPYCAFHYQIVLELNEPFARKDPPMAIILQDSERSRARSEQNSLSNDAFGHKFNERTYTHLLTSNRKLGRVDHGTMIFRDGLKDGGRILKALHINYMSHPDAAVRERLSSRLCAVKTDTDRAAVAGDGENRFFFKPCERVEGSGSGGSSAHGASASGHGSQRDRDNSYPSSSSQATGGSHSGGHHRDREPASDSHTNGGRENTSAGSSGRDWDSYGSGAPERRKSQHGSYGSSSSSSGGESQRKRDRDQAGFSSSF